MVRVCQTLHNHSVNPGQQVDYKVGSPGLPGQNGRDYWGYSGGGNLTVGNVGVKYIMLGLPNPLKLLESFFNVG